MVTSIIIEARRTLAQYRARQDDVDSQIVNFPASMLLEFHHTIAMVAKIRVFQVVPFHADSWQTEGFENVVWREASRSGLQVRRIYILPHRGIAPNLLGEQLILDAKSGIETGVLLVSSIPKSEQQINLDGLWIIDDCAIVVMTRGEEENPLSATWTVSERETDLRSGVDSWNKLWDWSEHDSSTSHNGIDLEEPLVLSADLINGVASVLCTSDHIDAESCSWYHSAWQYLRLLDMVSTPTWHDIFYKEELFKAFSGKNEAVRVLITGTADYSMLSYVESSMQATFHIGEVMILDKCPTPLFACRWYANRFGFKITTFEEDILNLKGIPGSSIDVICTDAFLTRFQKNDVGCILSVWGRLLNEGGKLITTVRMHTLSRGARDMETAIQDFRERATQRAKRWRSFLNRTPNEIGQLAEIYARKMHSEEIGDEEEICSLFEKSGFTIKRKNLVEVPGELYPTVYLELSCIKQG